MTTDIIIISGFLGAGKTTLIQKILKEAFQNEKVVLIENDFGEISLDAVLMKSSGVEIKEINTGCICCSLSGDFVKSLKEVLEQFQPDKVIIEPSGVSKLSDVALACADLSITPYAKVVSKITVIDVKRCHKYLENFGEFYEDQIQHADVLLLNRTEGAPEKLNHAKQMVQDLNSNAFILEEPIENVHANEIIRLINQNVHANEIIRLANQNKESRNFVESILSTMDGNNNVVSEHSDHEHFDHEHCDHEHNHSAEEIFTTLTIRTSHEFRTKELEVLISSLETKQFGDVVRLKGIVQGEEGPLNVQYIPGELQINRCEPQDYFICVIGHDLNHDAIINHFSGVRVEK